LDRRSFSDVPAHDVTHGADRSVSFYLDPPGLPDIHVKLENGHGADGEDFTSLREGDRVYGRISSDGRSLDSLHIKLSDRLRYTFAGWAEDITRQPDGSTTFRVVFPANPHRLWHPEGREPVTVTLPPGERMRWKDGRPYQMREGSSLTVVFDPDGGPPRVYHEAVSKY
jgi:hypothetical protein